jgi:hypothetical protein
MNRAWILLSVCLAIPAAAHADQAADTRQMLADYVRPYVQTLPREFHVYHWTAGSKITGSADAQLPPMDPRIRDYATRIKDLFWNPFRNADGGMAGDGLYVAIDPVASRSYGDTLLQIVMPEGTRFLAFGLQYFPPLLLRAMQAQGCDQNTVVSLFVRSWTSEDCRRLRDRVTRDLDIQAIRYSWSSSLYRICNRLVPWAFVIIDERALNPDRIVAFRPADAPQPDAHAYNRVLLNEIARKAGASFWTELDLSAPAMDVDAWIRDNLYGCGDRLEYR